MIQVETSRALFNLTIIKIEGIYENYRQREVKGTSGFVLKTRWLIKTSGRGQVHHHKIPLSWVLRKHGIVILSTIIGWFLNQCIHNFSLRYKSRVKEPTPRGIREEWDHILTNLKT